MRGLPPPRVEPGGIEPTFDDGLSETVRKVIAEGERALGVLRKTSVAGWISAGAALKSLQLAAMYRSNSN